MQKKAMGGLKKDLRSDEEIRLKDSPYIIRNLGARCRLQIFLAENVEQPESNLRAVEITGGLKIT